MSLAWVLRRADTARGAALQRGPLARAPEQELAALRERAERRRDRPRLVRRPPDARRSTTTSGRPGATATCRSCAGRSSRACSSRTSAPATGTPVQQTNCHPFRYGRWLFVHNGFIGGYDGVRRELLFAVDPKYFANIRGSTDSELMFHLALTFGLEDDPLDALERMAGFVEDTGTRHGIDKPLQMTHRPQRRRAALRGALRERAGRQLALRQRRRRTRSSGCTPSASASSSSAARPAPSCPSRSSTLPGAVARGAAGARRSSCSPAPTRSCPSPRERPSRANRRRARPSAPWRGRRARRRAAGRRRRGRSRALICVLQAAAGAGRRPGAAQTSRRRSSAC